MEDASMFKRTLVMTSWLVGVSLAWVAIVSLLGVTLATRALSGFNTPADESGTVRDSNAADGASPSTRGSAHPTTARSPRPNG